jgi:hypothetical protein
MSMSGKMIDKRPSLRKSSYGATGAFAGQSLIKGSRSRIFGIEDLDCSDGSDSEKVFNYFIKRKKINSSEN